MVVYLDISEFIGNPVHTGIQRVVRELISHWPADVAVRFCAYSAAGDLFYELPERTIRLACEGAGVGGVDAEELKRRIAASDAPERRRPLAIGEGRRLLVPEVFYDPARIDAYRRLAGAGIAPYVVAHDFSAYLYPDAFKITATGSNFFIPYLYFLRAAAGRAFSTGFVAEQYATRITRTRSQAPEDIVAPLGADGLGLALQDWSPDRRTILCLGSFDGKKQQEVLFDAYMASERAQAALDLLFIGRRPEAWQDTKVSPIFASTHHGVRVLGEASDADIRDAFAVSRASAFLGIFEGFGLPAVESLVAGVPVIAWSGLPAFGDLPAAGQVRIDTVDAASVRLALEGLVDDEVAAGLWRQARGLRLESWAGYARTIADWAAA